MAVLTAAGAGLALTGLSTVQNSTAGDYQETTAPDEPGYQARVVPTPTMAVLHRGPGGVLAGAWLLSLEPDDDGGSVLLVPTATVVAADAEGGDGGETTLDEVYRRDGAAAAAQAMGQAVTVAVAEHTEVDDARWARLVDPVGQVEVTLDEAVGDWPAGEVALAPDEVGPFLEARDGGETDLDRLDRQQLFWNAWLPLVAEAGPDAVPGEVGTGIGRFVLGVAGGGGTAAPLPVRRDEGAARGTGGRGGVPGDGVVFRPDAALLGEFVARTVPYPTAPAPGARIRVRLLNGTREAALTNLVARELVAGGAEVTIAGNAMSLDEAETTIAFTGADREHLATWLAARLGGARVEETPGGEDTSVASDEEIDVTVILGHDAEDLIGR
ncbi:MAG TPA: LCP family protein [Acidimicrobiales bacterium]